MALSISNTLILQCKISQTKLEVINIFLVKEKNIFWLFSISSNNVFSYLLKFISYPRMVCTVPPNIYKFPLMGLPENESYSEHGDYHTSNFSKKNWIRNFLSEKTKKI